MKLKCLLFFSSVAFAQTWAANSIVIEDFKKMPARERQEAISAASPEMKETLTKIDRQMLLVAKYGGEDGWKRHQIDKLLVSRGFGYLMTIFLLQLQFHDAYKSESLQANEKLGIAKEDRILAYKLLREEQDKLETRYSQFVRPLLTNVVSTPDLLRMEAKAQAIVSEMNAKFPGGPGNGRRRVMKDDLAILDRAVEEIIKHIKALPKLSPDRIDAELSALPEEELVR